MSTEENGNFSDTRAERVKKLTSDIMHSCYCKKDLEAVIQQIEDPFSWLGTGEQEYVVGKEKAARLFRYFSKYVIKYNISQEYYDVIQVTPDVFVCTGRIWLTTDTSAQSDFRVHQRITAVFRWDQDVPRCCHIHVSNPYTAMSSREIDFPQNRELQSYEYMQEYIKEQKRYIEAQAVELDSIYNTVPCAIMRGLRTKEGYQLITFNKALSEMMERTPDEIRAMDWSLGFCGEVVKEDRERLRSALQSLKRPGDHVSIDYCIKNTSGKRIYLSSNNSLISGDKDGQVIQRIAFDITQRKELEMILEQKSFEDGLTGLFNRNRFNHMMSEWKGDQACCLGVAYFDINGLKTVNDRRGHSAGDDLIRRTAYYISRVFEGKAYRIGGDEFVVIDDTKDEDSFRYAVSSVCEEMKKDGINISVGFSWRSANCNIKEQYDEADRLMYQNKEEFYGMRQARRLVQTEM